MRISDWSSDVCSSDLAIKLLAFIIAGVVALLVDEGVDRDCGLAGLAVADDQLALAAADRDERIERLEAGLHRLMNRFPRDDAGRLHLHALALGVFDRAFAVDRIAETVDHAAEQALADGNIDDRAGTADGVAFLDGGVRAEDHDTDIVGLEVPPHELGRAAGRERG